jgi:elongation factor G
MSASSSRANVGKPQVAYRETIRKAVEQGRLHPQEADRWLRPVRQGQHRRSSAARSAVTRDLRVREQGHRRSRPAEYIPSVDQGLQEAMQYGILAGYPLVGIKVS